IVETDWVEVEHRSLGVSENDVGDERTQQRLQGLLDANVFVYGSLSAGRGSDQVRLGIRAIDSRTRKDLGGFEQDLGSSGVRVVDTLPDLGTRLRNLLGASISSEEEAALAASRAHNLDAAKDYAEGLMRGRRWELEASRSHLEAAVAADPRFLAAQRQLLWTVGKLGECRSRSALRTRIWSRQDGLTARQAAIRNARSLDGDAAVAAWRALYEAMPDDLEVGIQLFQNLPPLAGVG